MNGTGNGQANLTARARLATRSSAKSESGNSFTITKAGTGPVTRTCTTASKGACQSGGAW